MILSLYRLGLGTTTTTPASSSALAENITKGVGSASGLSTKGAGTKRASAESKLIEDIV
jgi:hypothetical protein